MKKKALILLLLFFSVKAFSQNFSSKQYKEDFDFFWNTVNDNYCYFNKKPIDWKKLRSIYQPQIDTVSSRNAFVGVMEKALYELYDHHCSLNTNTPYSRRLVPTGADIWVEFANGHAVVKEVRRGFGADKVGIRAGMEIIAINGQPVDEAIKPFLAHTPDIEARNFALRLALAGDHITKRKITVKSNAKVTDVFPDKDGMMLENVQYPAEVGSGKIGSIGYIRINNFLFDDGIIAKFDSVLNGMLQQRALIIDLRETPSGGNTTVARAILSRFITKEHFYQKHELYAEEKQTGIKRSWEEIVSPRGKAYTKPVVVLADHWTGSIAEGITIAFDGMKRATVIGTELARLNGSIESVEMPNTHIRFNLPTERLYHINGQPRELYKPTIEVDVTRPYQGDLILDTALKVLQKTK